MFVHRWVDNVYIKFISIATACRANVYSYQQYLFVTFINENSNWYFYLSRVDSLININVCIKMIWNYVNNIISLQIRGIEVGIVVLVLFVWAGAIALFFNRWGKIRMLLPYQPDYKQDQLKVPGTGVCAAGACNGQHSHQVTSLTVMIIFTFYLISFLIHHLINFLYLNRSFYFYLLNLLLQKLNNVKYLFTKFGLILLWRRTFNNFFFIHVLLNFIYIYCVGITYVQREKKDVMMRW